VALGPEVISGKRLELLKEVVPRLSRVASLRDLAYGPPGSNLSTEAEMLGVQFQFLEVKGPQDFKHAFETANQGRAQALYVEDTPMLLRHHVEIADLAVRSRLPAVAAFRQFADAGLLMSYGVNPGDLHRRTAAVVDKILKGAKPADLPVEQPTKYELVINLKTAKALGLTIPPSVLARADEVIHP
jgi:putative ABC transport system substrate-binding protein